MPLSPFENLPHWAFKCQILNSAVIDIIQRVGNIINKALILDFRKLFFFLPTLSLLMYDTHWILMTMTAFEMLKGPRMSRRKNTGTFARRSSDFMSTNDYIQTQNQGR